jgi:hypothetical protein
MYKKNGLGALATRGNRRRSAVCSCFLYRHLHHHRATMGAGVKSASGIHLKEMCLILAIIALAFGLATGMLMGAFYAPPIMFLLLVILACALENNWYPLLAGAYRRSLCVLTKSAVLCACTDPQLANDAMLRGGRYNVDGAQVSFIDFLHADILSLSSAKDVGNFITSCFVVSGFGLILVLAHASVISVKAMALGLVGGIFVYGTIGSTYWIFKFDISYHLNIESWDLY